MHVHFSNAEGAYLKKLEYTVSVGADLSEHTPVISLKNELIQDKAAVKEILSYQFTSKSKIIRDALCMQIWKVSGV